MSQNASSKGNLLFVDDDLAFLQTVAELAAVWSRGAWQVHLANNSAKALAQLETMPVGVVVIDLQMPVVDGGQLLQLLQRKHPALHKVIFTGLDDSERRAQCLREGADLFLEKPRSREEWDTVFAALNELLNAPRQTGFQGMLRQVSLQDVLQMECLARNSSLLEIGNAQVRGRIYIHSGAVIHAETESSAGQTAFNLLLAQSGGEFHVKPFEPPTKRTIDAHWELLLMEAARLRDEAAETQVPAGSASPAGEIRSPNTQPEAEPALSADQVVPDLGPVVQIREMLICTRKGQVVYEWQCERLNARLQLLETIAQAMGALSRQMALGGFDRLIAAGTRERLISQIAPEHAVLVRSLRPSEAG